MSNRTTPNLKELEQADRSDMRIALYSHDALGVGHLRRNLRIASSIVSAFPNANVLLISGACEANFFSMPPGVDCIALPSLRKVGSGYAPRRLSMATSELIRMRAALIDTTIREFRPHAFIVDKLPRGVNGELEPVLDRLANSSTCRRVLGLRDILDDPQSVKQEWAREEYDTFTREHYSDVWIYGDRCIFDAAREYAFSPRLASRCQYMGYVDPRQYDGAATAPAEETLPIAGKYALCMCGGGEDGGEATHAFARATMPDGLIGVILTGPFMPAREQEALRDIASRSRSLRVVKFSGEPMPLIRNAERIVCMGGYNTICEVLTTDVPALVLPRTAPRLEQYVRATRMSDLGMFDVHAGGQSSSDFITRWLSEPKPRVRRHVDFGALGRLNSALGSSQPHQRAGLLEPTASEAKYVTR